MGSEVVEWGSEEVEFDVVVCKARWCVWGGSLKWGGNVGVVVDESLMEGCCGMLWRRRGWRGDYKMND